MVNWLPKLAMSALLLGASALSAAEYKDAPSLAAMVAAGKLPAVAARLPDAPEVVKDGAIGRYGGVGR